MQSTDGNQFWSPGQSLWSLIKEYVTESHLQTVRAALGQSLIDMYTEVHSEAEMWHQMWQSSQEGGKYSSRTGTPLPHQRRSPLSDPPVVKELVRAEVRMLLQTLRERATREGRNGEEFLLGYKPKTVNYALGYLDSSCSNFTQPEDNRSRLSSQCSVRSNAEEEIEAMRDKLNISDIDQVVDRLRSVLIEECEALKKQIKQLQGNIRYKSEGQCEFEQSEPTLEELKNLREAIQKDLELNPPSLTALASTPLPVKDMKSRFRLPSAQMASDKTLRALSAPSVLRPHPPPGLYHAQPRPPALPPLNRTSKSVKPISTLSNSHCQNRSTSATTGQTKTTICNWTRSVNTNSQFTTSPPRPGSNQMIKYDSSPSPEHNSVRLCCVTPSYNPSFRIKTERNSPTHKTHLSSSCSFHNQSRECDLSPPTERKRSLSWRSRNINIVPSPISALSPLCDAGGYECNNSSNSTDCYSSAEGKSKTQNVQQNCGCSLASATVQVHNDKGKSTSESFYSFVAEETSLVSEVERITTQTGNRKRSNGVNTNEIGRLGKNVTQLQSVTECSSHHPESSSTQEQDTLSTQKNGQFFTSSKRLLGGNAYQPTDAQQSQTETEFLNSFFQPVAPARVST